jgi:hypothetical protein
MRLHKRKSAGSAAETGLIASYMAYGESYEAIRSYITDKSPMAILEYRKKYSEAQMLYSGAAEDIKKFMTAAGVMQ